MEEQSLTMDKDGNTTDTYLVPLKDAEQDITQGLAKEKMNISGTNELISRYPNLSTYVKTEKTIKVGTTQQTTAPAKKTISESDVATKAAAAGYTTEEYRKLLIEKGITITK